jgi:methylated-DNA-[protein]-cysteine S-methyltransferase
MRYTTTYSSPIGLITLASDGHNLVGLWNEKQKYHGNAIYKEMSEKKDLSIFCNTKKWLDNYFVGKNPSISELPLAPAGSEFRQKIWRILCEIPYGKLITYGDIAKEMADKTNRMSMSSQAVGGAVGHNPISVIIPCHRVIGANGNLTGYAGGIGMKIKLLELEGVDTSHLFVPTKGTAL